MSDLRHGFRFSVADELLWTAVFVVNFATFFLVDRFSRPPWRSGIRSRYSIPAVAPY